MIESRNEIIVYAILFHRGNPDTVQEFRLVPSNCFLSPIGTPLQNAFKHFAMMISI